MKNWKWLGLSVVGFLVIVMVDVFLLQKDLEPNVHPVSQETAATEMRIILNGVTLDEIKENGKEIKYEGNWLAVGDLTFENVEIKGRGNATWLQEKKPYQIKLSEKADLLGLGKRRKWLLITSYWDETDLRTDTAFYLAHMVGEKFAHRGDFVELYVDDEYEGLYYLTRGIEIGKNAVDLRDSQGVLVELDNVYGKLEDHYYTTDDGECLTVKDIVSEDNIENAMMDFVESFNALEAAVRAKDFAAISDIIDVESFVQYYLISEFAANPDAYFTSQYFYKDGPEDKIHAGPAWDFDISFNNINIRTEFAPIEDMTKNIPIEYFENPDEQYLQWSRLFARLIKIPEFRMEVDKVFQERLSGRKNELSRHIIRQAAKIREVAVRDSEKWEKGDYMQAVKSLLEWVKARYDYFEIEYGTKRYQNYPAYDINVLEV